MFNAVIVMDNAKYHCSFPDSTPKGNWKKSQMQQACTERGIPFNPSDLKCVLWEKLREHNRSYVIPLVKTMALDHGHEVIYSPPHHSDLQLIELVWTIMKGEVGWQYTTNTTFAQVLECLNSPFENLQSKTFQGCINKANSHLQKLYEHIQALEDTDEFEEEESDGESDVKDDESNDDNIK